MAVRFGNTAYPKSSKKDADYPALRFLGGEWTVSTPRTCGKCYSVSFVFGRKLQSELLVPVGLMNAAVAGTGIDGWQYVAPGEPPIKTKCQNFIPKIEPLVGLRLARWALHKDHGRKDLVPSGPLYLSHRVEGRTIRVKFQYAQHGLMLARKDGPEPVVPTPDAAIPWLSLQAKDGSWHWADGKIDGSDLIVSSEKVTEPVAARYAYTQFPVGCNLYNRNGLPASPFSTCGY